MKVELYKATDENPNMKNYDEVYENFDWEEIEKNFSWSKTNKFNMAYECIDKHVDEGYGDKDALYYKNGDEKSSYTFKEMQEASNKAANILKNEAGVEKGDRVFIFMSRSPELYFTLLGALKAGAIVGPLFEAFMEKAVRDRLENSDAKVIVTTQELVGRIPEDDLPNLEKVIVVGERENENQIGRASCRERGKHKVR